MKNLRDGCQNELTTIHLANVSKAEPLLKGSIGEVMFPYT